MQYIIENKKNVLFLNAIGKNCLIKKLVIDTLQV